MKGIGSGKGGRSARKWESMPKMNGFEATRRITGDIPSIRVIGLSMFEKADQEEAMRHAGAVAYLSKDAPSKDLIAAIRAVVSS